MRNTLMLLGVLFGTAQGWAQLNFLSESRSITVSGAFRASDPDVILNYSGDFDLATNSPGTFGPFAAALSGSATGLYSNGLSHWTYPISVSANGFQSSTLGAQGMSCYMSLGVGADRPLETSLQGGVDLLFFTTFYVSSPVAYSLSCRAQFNPTECYLGGDLSSNDGDDVNLNGGNRDYSGFLMPDRTYTLLLYAHHPTPALAGPYYDDSWFTFGMTVVPEPCSAMLLVTAWAAFLARRWVCRSS